jgi:hypothetical protein
MLRCEFAGNTRKMEDGDAAFAKQYARSFETIRFMKDLLEKLRMNRVDVLTVHLWRRPHSQGLVLPAVFHRRRESMGVTGTSPSGSPPWRTIQRWTKWHDSYRRKDDSFRWTG